METTVIQLLFNKPFKYPSTVVSHGDGRYRNVIKAEVAIVPFEVRGYPPHVDVVGVLTGANPNAEAVARGR